MQIKSKRRDFFLTKQKVQVGDILLIQDCKDNGKPIGKHSFVVINNVSGQIESMTYDFVCNVMSSFKNIEQKERKLNYPGNIEIKYTDQNVINSNQKDGFIKTDQLYFFDENITDFSIIGSINEEFMEKLFEFIKNLDDFKIILDNLK